MPENFDIEHEEVNLQLAGEDKLGVKGLNLVYLSLGNNVELRLNEQISGGIADITRRDARGIPVQKTHIETTDQGGSKVTTATVSNVRDQVLLCQVSKQSKGAGGSDNFDTESTGYNGWRLRSTHSETDAQGNSTSTVKDRNGRLERSSQLSAQVNGAQIHAEAVTKYANSRGSEVKTLDLYQQASSQSGDFVVKDGNGPARELVHFDTSNLPGNGTLTDAVVKDSLGRVTTRFRIETGTDQDGKGGHVDIQKKDSAGHVVESIHVQITYGAGRQVVDETRANALGRTFSSTHMEIGK